MSKAITFLCAGVTSSALLAGCTTMDALKSSGDNFSKGNLLAGTMNLVFTPIALAYDVVTLGGNVSPDVSTAAVGAYAEGKGYVPAGTTSQMIAVSSTATASSSNDTASDSASPMMPSTTAIDTVAATGARSGAGTKGNCRANTAFLETRIPRINNAEFNNLRDAAVSTDIVDAMRQANGQGYTPQSAVQALLAQARENDARTAEALKTASAVDALGTTDDEFLNRIRTGTINLSTCDGLRNAALCAAAMMKLGAITNRAVAAEMQCHIRAGTWPKGTATGSAVASSSGSGYTTSKTATASVRSAPASWGSYDPHAANPNAKTTRSATAPSASGGPVSSNKGAR